MAEVDINVLTAALKSATMQTLPRVELRPELLPSSEPSPPPDPESNPPPPSVMLAAQLVSDKAYRFTYASCRYLWIQFLLERVGAGRSVLDFYVMHDLSSAGNTQESEVGGATDLGPFIPPSFTTNQSVKLGFAGAIGVTLDVMHDSSTSGSGQPAFGISFKITSATPTAYPYVTGTVVKAIPMEG